MYTMSGELTINLGALKRNYKTLDKLSAASCETACVVKADAYGLGADKCAPALYEAGARSFFVATTDEALSLRNILYRSNDALIYVLGGLGTGTGEGDGEEQVIIPVLNSLEEIKFANSNNLTNSSGAKNIPIALHFDTGMNRLGVDESETQTLYENPSILDNLNICLVISHLASSEQLDNSDNAIQLAKFDEIKRQISELCPKAQYSLADTGGIFLNKNYHFDLIRIGIALYGARPITALKNNLIEPVIALNAPVLQIKTARKGEGAGYNATYKFDKDTKLAIVSIGYADGFQRSLSNKGILYWKGYALPIRGRVSMDSVICDLSNVPESDYPMRGDMIEVIGSNQSIDDLAVSAGTIPYEILTSLGKRYRRTYKY